MRTNTLTLAAAAALISSAPAFANREGAFLYASFDPNVIYNDAISRTVLQVATTKTGVTGVQMQGAQGAWIDMYDDGTHGDKKSGDGIYTLDKITTDTLGKTQIMLWFGGTHVVTGVYLRINKSDGSTQLVSGWAPSLGIVDKSQVFESVQLASGIYSTGYAVGIVDPSGKILGGKIPLATIKCGKTAFGAFQRLYSVFDDRFDFVVVMPAGTIYDPTRDYAENVPYAVPAKNDVQNIGMTIFDDTPKFFSAGRLRAMVFHSFGYGAILDHEVGHAWSAWDFCRDLGLTDGVHWEEETDVAGQMSKYVFAGSRTGHLQDNGDGTWRVVPTDPEIERYSWLDLYMMGLAPPGKVKPIHRLIQPDYSDADRVTADEVETYSIQGLMDEAGGARVPAAKDSPKSFKIAFILVKNKSFTPAEMAWISLIAKYFCSKEKGEHYLTTFYTATYKRGTLDPQVPLPDRRRLTVDTHGK